MGELTNITAKVGAIEGDLSVIMQLLRVAATADGYEITSAGLDELSGMVFAVSLRVSALGLDISTLAGMNRDLLAATRSYVASVRRDEADIAELVQTARQSIPHAKKGDREGWSLLEQCLDLIDKRAMPAVAPPDSNVIPFARPEPQDVLGGGAA